MIWECLREAADVVIILFSSLAKASGCWKCLFVHKWRPDKKKSRIGLYIGEYTCLRCGVDKYFPVRRADK